MASINMAAIKDAVMGKQFSGGTFSGWNGKDNHIQVGATTSYKWRGVIKFPLWTMPAFNTINSAVIRLYFYSTQTPHAVQDAGQLTDMKIGRMTADWSEGTIDPGEGNLTSNLDWEWDNRYNKFTAGIIHNNIDQTATGNSIDLDVTSIVEDWLVDGNANYGFILINNSSETNDAKALLFYSEDYGGGYAPKLIIEYDENTAPTSVDNTLPADASIVNTLTPTFYGELNDPDGDDITAWQIQVKPSTSSINVWNSGYQTVSSSGTQIAAAGNTISVPYGTGGVALPLASGVTYDWSMTLWDAGGVSVTSTTTSFTTNASPNAPSVTVTPTPLSSVPDSTPNISLQHNDPDPADTTAYGYTVTIEEESTLGAGDWSLTWSTGDVDITSTPLSTINVTSTTLDWGTSYRVYARTQDSNGAWGPYSSPVTFQTQQTTAPTSLAPDGGSTTTTTPTLSGSRGDAADTITKFSIRVYSDDLQTAMLSETEYTTTTNGSTFSRLYAGATLIAGTSYKWSAKVYSDIGGYSDWSDWASFTVESDTSVPTLTSPVGDSGYTLTPTVTITRASAFDYINYEIYPESSTQANLGTPHDQSGDISQTSDTSYSDTYAGTTLEWATGYKIRARVSSDSGSNWSNWSGLYWFATSSVDGPPVLTSVEGETSDPAWIATASPYFEITRYSGDANAIDKMQYRIFNASGSTTLYDSGMTDVTDAASAYLEYTAGLLVPGTSYKWDARYQNDAGPISPYSTKGNFRLNGPPAAPAGLFPPSGYVYLDTETKTFRADFSDPDEGTFSDYPVDWEIYIHNEDTDSQHGATQSVTSGLTPGENETTWAGTAFSTGVNYSWRTRFQDSKNEWGAWSASTGFKVSTPPNGTITTPTDDSNVTTVTPQISWSITGDQDRYTIQIDKTDAIGNFVKSVTTLEYTDTATTSDSVVLPAGYLVDGNDYDITLTIWNEDQLADPSPSTVWVHVVLDAPDPILNVDSLADLEQSKITLSWDQMSLKTDHSFVAYRIYRRLKSYTDWVAIGEVTSRATISYQDWYAGHNVNYQYVVRAVTKKAATGLELVSGDDPNGTSVVETQIASTDWHFVGEDRAPSHNSLLVVESESHNRPIQQEVFETLGSSRKVIMRGFVLGHEGSISTLWFNKEVIAPEDSQLTMVDTYRGKRIVDYLTRTPGPHILKSPFGDVWDVQFATPNYEWLPVGHLSVELEWIETGMTSENDY